MAENTAIEWAHHTFNPWIGCTKVSPACDNCYAEAWDRRFAVSGHAMRWGPHAKRTRTSAANWHQPIKWNSTARKQGIRQRVFCASLADVFDNQVPDAWRADLLALIAETPNLDWLLLTKRPQNIARMLGVATYQLGLSWGEGWENVWLGTTVENQAEANRRIPHLLSVPSTKRFLSCEPLLGPVDLRRIWVPAYGYLDALADRWFVDNRKPARSIDMVIVGGESGPKARPTHPDWVRVLRNQCVETRCAFFLKQWGEWLVGEPTDQQHEDNPCGLPLGYADGHEFDVASDGDDIMLCSAQDESQGPTHIWRDFYGWQGHLIRRVGKKRAGRLLDGREWNELPEFQPAAQR